MSKKPTPSIRFKEFSDKWEEKRIDEWGFFYYGHSCPKWSVTPDATIPCIRYGELYTKFGAKIDNVHSYTSMPEDCLRFSKGNEVLIPRVGEDPMDYNHCTWLSLKNVAIGEMISVFNTEQSPYFTAIMFNAMLQKDFAIRVEGGSVTNLYYDQLKEILVSYPSVGEQEKIAAFFDGIDTTIQLNKENLKKMQQIRLSFLKTLFASKDEKIPQIRFNGFNGKWPITQLSVVISPYNDYLQTPTDGYTRLGIRSHMKGTFYEYVAPSKQLGEKRLQRVKRDNFIVNIVFAWEHAIAVTTEEDEGKLVSHRFPQFSFNKGMYPRFFHYALNDERFRHHLWLASPSGAGRNKTLRIDEMLEYELRVPEYEEQKKIADFLTSLDELIELYDYRITKLQNIKAACLQGMFV
ncbi:MAG: restriction endonuclease subunit S [Oscillospiraceae bacterium]|nr:restriction endonuclease subunit S [Oscillospiraceae bacterium]